MFEESDERLFTLRALDADGSASLHVRSGQMSGRIMGRMKDVATFGRLSDRRPYLTVRCGGAFRSLAIGFPSSRSESGKLVTPRGLPPEGSTKKGAQGWSVTKLEPPATGLQRLTCLCLPTDQGPGLGSVGGIQVDQSAGQPRHSKGGPNLVKGSNKP